MWPHIVRPSQCDGFRRAPDDSAALGGASLPPPRSPFLRELEDRLPPGLKLPALPGVFRQAGNECLEVQELLGLAGFPAAGSVRQ